jgi:hypothetical protein
MNDVILIGRQERILEVPAEHWRKHLAGMRSPSERLSFMTSDHHLVRNFVVRELPRNQGRPLNPQGISSRLQLPLSTVISILDDLEQHLFFLVRNEARQVSWAFPVTSEITPHWVRFSSGECIFAA